MRSRYSRARVTAWRRSLRARAASAKAGATAAGGARRPSRTATIEIAEALLIGQHLNRPGQAGGDFGPSRRQQLVNAALCQGEQGAPTARALPATTRRPACGKDTPPGREPGIAPGTRPSPG